MKKRACIMITTLTLASGFVIAEETEGSTSTLDNSRVWSQLDANQDGKVSVDEAREDMSILQHFRLADQNKDGQLDRKEFTAAVNLNTETEEAE